MSLLTESSPKHCATKGFHFKINKKLVYTLTTSVSSLLFLILLLYLILHPSPPEFYLQDTSVSLSSPSPSPSPSLNSTLLITLLSKNPNSRVGIYYNNLKAYAVYKSQRITGDSSIPGFYQGEKDTNMLSSSLYGVNIPVGPSIGYEVGRDQSSGRITLSVRLDGELKWKVASWVSGQYRFGVDCIALVVFRPRESSPVRVGSVQGTQCSTDV